MAGQRLLSLLLILALVAAACSGDDDSIAAAPDTASVSSTDSGQEDATTSTPEQGEETEAGDPAEPAVRVAENGEPVSESNWVARTFMDEGRVEVVWSPVDGVENYELYRLPTAEANYDAIALGDLDGAERVYEGLEFGFVDDEDLPVDTFLTYVLVADLGNDVRTEPRWTEALTTSDVTPPTPITGLGGSVTDEGVLLEWAASTDDVEFAAYSVSVLVEDGNYQYIGGGAEENQTSFVDNAPLSGEVTYRVQAFDFHDNGSDFAEITVDVP